MSELSELPMTLEQLVEFARKCRLEKMAVNAKAWETGSMSRVRLYGSPTLQVIDPGWLHVHDRQWDHTLESIRECAEVADQVGGNVSGQYSIMEVRLATGESEEVDDGFEIQVYPRFALRTHNTYVDIVSGEGGNEEEVGAEEVDEEEV